jgi:hypothetical protein
MVMMSGSTPRPDGEVIARAAITAENLVGDEQDIVPVADLRTFL